MNIYKEQGQWYVAIESEDTVKVSGPFPYPPTRMDAMRRCAYVGPDSVHVTWDIYIYVYSNTCLKVNRREVRVKDSGRKSGLWLPTVQETTSIYEDFC